MSKNVTREQVGTVFENVAPYYDAMNDYLSLGTHHLWKKWFCQQFEATPDGSWLDIATGSGDILIAAIQAQLAKKYYGLDPSPPMLQQAQWRLATAGLQTPRLRSRYDIELITSVAEDLSFFSDAQIDGISCAFGLRNMTQREQALSEMARVLKKSKKCHILEFAPPSASIPMKVYGLYLKYLLPEIGGWAFGDKPSYEYLSSSIQEFWGPLDCQHYLLQAGFINVKAVKIFGGIAYYYSGEKA